MTPAIRPMPPILITGASGTLGRAFERICQVRGLASVLLSRAEMDIADPCSVAQAMQRYQPWAVVNAAGYVRVDDAENDQARCFRENSLGPVVLAQACAAHGVQLLTFSSDLVFDGRQTQPYTESATPRPLNIYGQSKLRAEQAVLLQLPTALVVRTSAFFGPWDEYNFVHAALRAAREEQPFLAASDAFVAPTYVPDLVNTSLDLLIDAEAGIWHLANQGAFSWEQLARTAAEAAGFDTSFVQGQPTRDFDWPARRPGYSVLGSERAVLMPTVESALWRYVADARHLLTELAVPPAERVA